MVRSLTRALLAAAFVAVVAPCVLAQMSGGQAVETITLQLSNFAFTPERLTLRVGTLVRLHLINEAGRGHNFSAPELFAASVFPSGSPPPGGKIEVAGGSSADVTLVPRVPGTYRIECTHFLHSLFGMTGTAVVGP